MAKYSQTFSGFFSPPLDHRGVNVRHNIKCQTRKLKANLCRLRASFTCSISYCKDNIKCDIASNAPKCLLNNGVSIVQKLVVKLSNTSTTFSQQVEITFNVILTITNAISKTYLQAAQNGFQFSGPTSYAMTYIHLPGPGFMVIKLSSKIFILHTPKLSNKNFFLI